MNFSLNNILSFVNSLISSKLILSFFPFGNSQDEVFEIKVESAEVI